MGSRPIDPGDAVWLHMDRPHNLMVVESLMTLAEPVDWIASWRSCSAG